MNKTIFCGVAITLITLAGCERRQEVVVDQPGPERKIEVQRGAQGTEIEFHQQEAQRHLDQAGRDLGQGARELGQAIAHGAQQVGKEVEPVAKQTGQQLAEGARQAGRELQETGREVGRRAGPALSDAAITARVQGKLLTDSQLNGFKIGVSTTAGEVTLSGKVSTPEQKAEAERVALKTDGVRRVINSLEVGS
jgi:osmotically-inducible protein OsmY